MADKPAPKRKRKIIRGPKLGGGAVFRGNQDCGLRGIHPSHTYGDKTEYWQCPGRPS